MRVHFTEKSSNRKVGKISVTTTEESSCPSSCPLKGKGCYAEGGPLAILWNKVSSYDDDWNKFCQTVEDKATALWRHNQAGDLPHKNGDIDKDKLFKLVEACQRSGKKGFTYTHHDMVNKDNRLAVMVANKTASFVINLSGNSMEHADQLADLNSYGHKPAPVVTVLPSSYERQNAKKEWTETLKEYKSRVDLANVKTPKGRKITVCPASYLDDMDCARCKLCSHVDRETIVGFPAHGFRKKKATEVANAK